MHNNVYILQYINLNFQKLVREVNILYAFFVKYALNNFRSPNQYTISLTYFQLGSASE